MNSITRALATAACASIAITGLTTTAWADETGTTPTTVEQPPISGENTTIGGQPVPANAIISEGNGAAVFAGYASGAGKISLRWDPERKYADSTILYQVQRSDGAMLLSKSRATSFNDMNLAPNTNYTYTLTTFEQTSRDVPMRNKKGKVTKVNGRVMTMKKTITKAVGKNEITVATIPGQVIGLTVDLPQTKPYNGKGLVLSWSPPQESAIPLTYSVAINGNLRAVGLTTPSYTEKDPFTLSTTSNVRYEVTATNSSGTGGKATLSFKPGTAMSMAANW